MMDWRQTINGIDLLFFVWGGLVGYAFRWFRSWGAKDLARFHERGDLTLHPGQEEVWPCDRCNRAVRIVPGPATAIVCRECGGTMANPSTTKTGRELPGQPFEGESLTARMYRTRDRPSPVQRRPTDID